MRPLSILFLAIVLASCTVPNGRAAPEEDPWVTGDMASSLEVGIMSGAVRLSLRITNTSETSLALTFATAQRYDFAVETADGRELWRWSSDRAFAQVVTEAELEPGETWSMEATWEPEVEPGTYEAVGWLTASDFPLEHRTPFELP